MSEYERNWFFVIVVVVKTLHSKGLVIIKQGISREVKFPVSVKLLTAFVENIIFSVLLS